MGAAVSYTASPFCICSTLRTNFAHRKQVEAMLAWAEQHPEYTRCAVLYLFTYVFLLRLPSEALPAIAGGEGCPDAHSILVCDGSKLTLTLQSRKNRPQGSQLTRGCWCSKSAATCPVRVLGRIVGSRSPGEPLFGGISSKRAATNLRHMLHETGVKKSSHYRTHDLRRGHARDLQLAGSYARLLQGQTL